MNEVGGESSGTGLQGAGKTSRTSDANFEYDDEWDVGIGNLIIDLDADIEKNNEASRSNSTHSNSPIHSHSPNSSLTPPAPTIPSPMHIPQTSGSSGTTSNNSSKTKSSSNSSSFSTKTAVVSLVGNSSEISSMDHIAAVDKRLKMKIKRTKSGADAKHEIVKTDLATSLQSSATNNNNSSLTGKSSGGGGSTNESKSAHSSSSHKDKDGKIKDGGMIMIDAESISGSGGVSNHSNSANNGLKDASEQGKKGQRKGKETHKKVKNGGNNVGSKKDERNSTTSVADSKSSSSSNPISNSHNNTSKDGKDYFTATVSLNVPTILPTASSAFSKTTLKVPSTSTLSTSSSTSQNSLQSSSNVTMGWSPTKAADKSLLLEKGNASPNFGKKVKGISAQDDLLGISSVAPGFPGSFAKSSDSISATVYHQGPSVSSTPRISRTVTAFDECIGTSQGEQTDPDCIGPCEPGTAVTLEGIVWHENENGILVVNVTWRGKTYVGTLIDCTKNDWAPPRFCDSPTSDLEIRTPKNRAKRGRGVTTPVTEQVQSELSRIGNVKLRNGAKGRRGSATNSAFLAPASPLKGEQWPKRKTRGSENDSQDEPSTGGKATKRLKKDKDRQSDSPIPSDHLDKIGGPSSPALIECPEPNCSKKYKHMNGLRYHQSHAHNNFGEDSDSNASTASTQLTTPTDGIERPGSEPMAIDSLCDLDGESSLLAGDDESSKRSLVNDLDENARLPDKDGESQDSPLSLIGKLSNNKAPKGGKEELEVKQMESTPPPTTALTSRAPILTVPSFSLQNRSSHISQDNSVMKPSPLGGTIPILQAKGISWQPHVPTFPPNSSGSTLNIPSNPSLDKVSRDKSIESHGKKNKHKKKSKEKDREGKSKSDSSSKSDKSKEGGRGKFSKESHHGRETSGDVLRMPKRGEDQNLKDSNMGGENRDDPQSPAYSDISDANDSGDADINVGGKEGSKGSELKKKESTTTVIPPSAPYFSPFYSPYLDPSKIGDKGIPPEDSEKQKSKPPQVTPLPPTSNPNSGAIQNNSNPDDQGGRRGSPKIDFHPSKYLPHQQHFFHYPYSNYHFEQGQFNNMMQPDGGGFGTRGGFPPSSSSEEREKERELLTEMGKNKSPTGDHHVNIKLEPGHGKDGRPFSVSSKSGDKLDHVEIKSEFSGPNLDNYVGDSQKSHFLQTCSKHSRDGSKRDDIGKAGDSLRADKTSKEDSEKDAKEKEKNEGAKPTMETTGPPPPPTAGSYAYLPQSYLPPGAPFGLHFDPGHPLYRQVMVPGPYGGGPYGMHPGPLPRYPPPPQGCGTPLPEDLSRPTGPQPAKALDVLQQHAQYYQVHKIHELSERALKSPNPQVAGVRGVDGGRGEPSIGIPASNTPTSPAGGNQGQSSRNSVGPSGPSPNLSKLPELSKESKLGPGGLNIMNESSRSPPTQHHVHSHTHQHHHTHVGFPIPIMPAFPAPHAPYGVLPTPPTASPVIPPFPSKQT